MADEPISTTEYLKERMNPADQTPLRPPSAVIAPPPSSPPLMSMPRPMPPPPPMALPAARARGIFTSGQLVERPKTEHAKELERLAAEPKPRPRLCPTCGGVKRINEIRDKRGSVVGFAPCPECVEL